MGSEYEASVCAAPLGYAHYVGHQNTAALQQNKQRFENYLEQIIDQNKNRITHYTQYPRSKFWGRHGPSSEITLPWNFAHLFADWNVYCVL